MEKTSKNNETAQLGIGAVSGSISMYKHKNRDALECVTYLDFFNGGVCLHDDKTNGILIFSKPSIFGTKKVINVTKKVINKKNSAFRFNLSHTELEEGVYSDIDFANERIYLYYR